MEAMGMPCPSNDCAFSCDGHCGARLLANECWQDILLTLCLMQVSKLGPDKPWLVLDGAHTPASAAALAKTLEQTFQDLPIGFIVAMADDKDHAGIYLSRLGRHQDCFLCYIVLCWHDKVS